MPAVSVDHQIARDLANPEMKRQRWIPEILIESLAGFEQHILHDIAGIDAPRYSRIEPQTDHPPQRWPVPFPERVGSRRIGLSHSR